MYKITVDDKDEPCVLSLVESGDTGVHNKLIDGMIQSDRVTLTNKNGIDPSRPQGANPVGFTYPQFGI